MTGLAAVAGVTLVACQLLLGIDDAPFGLADAGLADAGLDATATEAAPIADPCPHAFPPAVPAESDPMPENTYFFGVSSIDFVTGSEDGGEPAGFDLDRSCTCDTRDGTANGGAPSCTPPADATATCDQGLRGVDNALGSALSTFDSILGAGGAPSGAGFDAQYGQAAICGERALLLALTGYNGRKDDRVVGGSLLESYGIRRPQDGGALSPSAVGCGKADAGPPFPPKGDGTDEWSLPAGSVYDRQAQRLKTSLRAWVTNYTLVVDARDTPTGERIAVGSLVLNTIGSVLTAKLIPLGADRLPLPLDANGEIADGKVAAAFGIESGVLGGRAPVEAFLESMRLAGIPGAGGPEPLCNYLGGSLYGFVRDNVCSSRDTVRTLDDDFKARPCDSLSFAVRFHASPAQISDDTHEFDAGVSPCATSVARCP